MFSFCCDILFRTPCCCCEFYDHKKYLKSDLEKVCRSNNTKLLMFLIENYYNEIDINYPYYNNDTLLQWACKAKHINIILQINKIFIIYINFYKKINILVLYN